MSCKVTQFLDLEWFFKIWIISQSIPVLTDVVADGEKFVTGDVFDGEVDESSDETSKKTNKTS